MRVHNERKIEKYHTPNHALRDSISLSLFFSRYALKKRKLTKLESFLSSLNLSRYLNKISIHFFWSIFLGVSFSGMAQNGNYVNEKIVVVIDAGHGGYDSGTMDGNGHLEKNINLYVAKYVKFYLKKFSPEIKVVLTRDQDVFLSLDRRSVYPKVVGADLFISLHCNHNPNSRAEGVEIYVQNTTKESVQTNLKKAIVFGNILDRNMVEKLGYKSRGILRNNYQVLRESISFTPGILIEMGFFSNKDESQYLNSRKGINGLSLAITKSIMDYFEKK
ncbi:N-acetylmuramoyl-L-alanine amidase [Flagellimonas hymeniacidonis]|uniref:N-acetylmuramoyl-L-alanine amidase n=1 Tax=Flagellimonas hymeniacidonis TaxID=2603628 RepID=A0A5C8V7K4_9FLAO|nr:N-acetylmuramoyl-L-alanine amidase [Flagellimonas hymeniacidonis]TXN37701.1 N-acetylmuramoyl-L-alanine amidase [Flagellimonas hymeniacidonis]